MPLLDGPTPEQKEEEANRQQALTRARMILGTYYLVLPFILIYLLFKIFPPNPWWPPDYRAVQMVFFVSKLNIWTTLEERLILLVIVAGALGSYIHSATSYADFRGNRQFGPSWLLWYLLRPFIGVCLALVVYFAIRGGLLSMVLSGDTSSDPTKISPFGIAAIAGLTGMFSKQAADKLAEVFNTLFKSQGDASRKDSLTPGPTITSVDPPNGPVVGGTRITIMGTGFAAGTKILVGGKAVTNIEIESDTIIKADTPAGDLGVVDVDVVNDAGQKSTKTGGYTYTAGEVAGAAAGGAGAGGAGVGGAGAGAGGAGAGGAGDGGAGAGAGGAADGGAGGGAGAEGDS
jgi:hypothetical protein